MHLEVVVHVRKARAKLKYLGERCLKEWGRQRESQKRGKVSEGDGGGDSLMLSEHGWMCVTQSQIGNRCFNLASLRGYPLH